MILLPWFVEEDALRQMEVRATCMEEIANKTLRYIYNL